MWWSTGKSIVLSEAVVFEIVGESAYACISGANWKSLLPHPASQYLGAVHVYSVKLYLESVGEI